MRIWTTVALAAVLVMAGVATAAPPIPLHQLEGSGGVVLTEMAYLVNPGEGEEWYGLPSFSVATLLANNKSLDLATVSETLFKRLELSYSIHRFNIGDWASDVGAPTSNNNIYMHNFNARVALLNEGQVEQAAWLPALTFGFHYKRNITIESFNRDLGGTMGVLGVKDKDGEEYTLTATKMIEGLMPNPLVISATVRNTDAVHVGWGGFTEDRDFLFEGNIAYFLMPNLIVGAEYRQKADNLNFHVPNAVEREEDWWSIAVSYIVNEHWNVTGAYANLGTVLNHDEPFAAWLQVKYEL